MDPDAQNSASYALIAVAGSVTPDAAERARKTVTFSNGELVLCALSLAENRAWLDGSLSEGTDSRQFVQRVIASCVLGAADGKLPRGDEGYTDEYLETVKDFDDKTFGQFLAEMKSGDPDDEKQKLDRLFSEMKDGEIRQEDDTLYYRADGRGMEIMLDSDEDYPGHYVFFAYEITEWCWPEDKKATEKELNEIKILAQRFLEARGFTYSDSFAKDDVKEQD